MQNGINAQVLRIRDPNQSSLVHLVQSVGTTTLCGAYARERLTTPQGLDSEVCAACLEHLKALWEHAADGRAARA